MILDKMLLLKLPDSYMGKWNECELVLHNLDKASFDLAHEAMEAASQRLFLAAYFSTVVLLEFQVKQLADKNSGNFRTTLDGLHKNKVISDEEYEQIDYFREIRNKFFHENHYMWAMEDVRAGNLTFFSEDLGKEKLWNDFCVPMLQLVQLLNERTI